MGPKHYSSMYPTHVRARTDPKRPGNEARPTPGIQGPDKTISIDIYVLQRLRIISTAGNMKALIILFKAFTRVIVLNL